MALIAGYLFSISVIIAGGGRDKCLVSSVTGQTLHLSKVLNNKVYHGTLKVLLGRDHWWLPTGLSTGLEEVSHSSAWLRLEDLQE